MGIGGRRVSVRMEGRKRGRGGGGGQVAFNHRLRMFLGFKAKT